MTDAKLVKTIFLNAPRERVWAYLTEADKLARWFHEGQNDLKAGEDYALLSEHRDRDDPRLVWGKVLEANKPNKLVYTFSYKGAPDRDSLVEWILTEVAGGTQLTMTHTYDDVPADRLADEIGGTDKGWDGHLTRLRSLVN